MFFASLSPPKNNAPLDLFARHLAFKASPRSRPIKEHAHILPLSEYDVQFQLADSARAEAERIVAEELRRQKGNASDLEWRRKGR